MSLYDRALAAKRMNEMEDIWSEANRQIGNKAAPIDQEPYLVYGYAQGWMDARRDFFRHMKDYHPEIFRRKENAEDRESGAPG